MWRTLSFVKLSKKRKLVIKQPSYGFEYLIHQHKHEHNKNVMYFLLSLVPKYKSLKGFTLNVLEISFLMRFQEIFIDIEIAMLIKKEVPIKQLYIILRFLPWNLSKLFFSRLLLLLLYAFFMFSSCSLYMWQTLLPLKIQ